MKTKLFSILAAFSFVWAVNAQNYVQLGADIDAEAAENQFGCSVSQSADGYTVAIGGRTNGGAGFNAGHVRVYHWNGSSWIQQGADIDGENPGDLFGFEVSLDAAGNTVAVGANYNDDNGTYSGHVRVFDYDGTSWIQRGNTITGQAANDYLGHVALNADGNTMVIGASGRDVGSAIDAGNARVFNWNGSNWVQVGADIEGTAANDYLSIVSINNVGDIIAVGARNFDGSSFTDNGVVRAYSWSGSSWVQMGADIEGSGNYDNCSIAALNNDGHTLVVGAPANSVNGLGAGQVRVFDWSGTSWVQRGADLYGAHEGDQLGFSVAISAGGDTVISGAHFATGTSYAGETRIYAWDGTAWSQCGDSIPGETPNDQAGTAVSISDDGHVAAIGAIYNQGMGLNAGHVRVYSNTAISGIASPSLAKTFLVYPNPASDLVHIVSTPGATIEVFNSFGNCISRFSVNGSLSEFNVGALPAGIYTLRMSDKLVVSICTISVGR
jgi:hypothetical protein